MISFEKGLNMGRLIKKHDDLNFVYSPEFKSIQKSVDITAKINSNISVNKNTVAIVMDQTSAIEWGNVGPQAALAVMEQKALVYKHYADLEAFPLFLNTYQINDVIDILKNVTSMFAGVNLNKLNPNRSFEIEQSLAELGVPIYDDQHHGLVIATLAAIINSCVLAHKKLENLRIVVNGIDVISVMLVQVLLNIGQQKNRYQPVKELIMCDELGIISRTREDILLMKDGGVKKNISNITNKNDVTGFISDALLGADVFIDFLGNQDLNDFVLANMNEKPFVFSLADHNSESMNKILNGGSAFITASVQPNDPNRINHSLVFPGIFRGMIDSNAHWITSEMEIAASYALAESVERLSVDHLLPQQINKCTTNRIAKYIKEICIYKT